jgi:hypothetical protein
VAQGIGPEFKPQDWKKKMWERVYMSLRNTETLYMAVGY